jgi:cation transport ATPase
MKKVFKIDVDCANCAAKIERAISEIQDVNSVSVNYLTQKMIIEIPDEKFQETMRIVEKTAHKVEPDFEILK